MTLEKGLAAFLGGEHIRGTGREQTVRCSDVKATAAPWVERPTAGGATWVASTPGGLHISEGLQPRHISRTAVAVRIVWRAEPFPTWRRPMASGKQRAYAPEGPPG
jgi:hypothetical protein